MIGVEECDGPANWLEREAVALIVACTKIANSCGGDDVVLELVGGTDSEDEVVVADLSICSVVIATSPSWFELFLVVVELLVAVLSEVMSFFCCSELSLAWF